MFGEFLSTRLEAPASTYRVGRRRLLGLGAFALAAGWALTEAIVSFPSAVPVSPTTAAVGLRAVLFAAGLEVSLLFIGIGAFAELVSGLYLLLAFVHPTPLALDAYPGDLGAGPDAAVQLSLYAAGLGLVLVL